MKTFKVNKYITLKLEYGYTNIYINGAIFRQCKYLLLKNKIEKLENLLKIDSVDKFEESIDEISENLDNALEGGSDSESLVYLEEAKSIDIPPETEFWAHASNLQIWAENNYNTKLLHSNLSFPLLKRLWQLEDPIAIKAFHQEILKRFKEGYLNTVLYLLMEGYHNFLDKDRFKEILLQNNKSLERTIKKCINKENSEKRSALFILKILSSNNDFIASRILKEFILENIKKQNKKIIQFICKENIIGNNLFTKDEIVHILHHADLPIKKKIMKMNLDFENLLKNIRKKKVWVKDYLELLVDIICLASIEDDINKIKRTLLGMVDN